MKVNPRTAYLAVFAAFAVVELNGIIKIIREERHERKEIEKQKEIDLAAIRDAQTTISEMIHEGVYDGRGPATILKDFNDLVSLNKAKSIIAS